MTRVILPVLKNPRFWLCGPFVLLVSLLFMLAMAVWFPPGAGKVNNIIMPLVMFPLIWATLFFYCYLGNNLIKIFRILLLLLLLNGAILAFQFLV